MPLLLCLPSPIYIPWSDGPPPVRSLLSKGLV